MFMQNQNDKIFPAKDPEVTDDKVRDRKIWGISL